MTRKGCFPVPSETAHAGVLPNIGSTAAKSSQFNIVDVLCAAVLIDEYEFVC